MSIKSLVLAFSLALLALPQFVIADGKNEIEEAIVTAHPLGEQGTSQSISTLSGEELAEKLQGSLGETIALEPGVRSGSFGAAVGRPIIHGLGGARVKTTEDRIDSLDVSVTSTDHAVTIEPFIANTITILRGSSTLLYGAGAIGGVVDVETGRIPKNAPEGGVEGRFEARYEDNSEAKTAAFRLDGGKNNAYAWHLDVFDRDADDYKIPGFVESARVRALEEAEAAGEVEEEARDVLAGSFLKNRGGALGFSVTSDRGFIGLAVSGIDAEYGLVGGHGEGEEEEGEMEVGLEEAPGRIELEQTRLDIEAQRDNPITGFSTANFRLGINDYEHQEIEGNGEIGTLFENKAWEARLQLTHEPLLGFTGHLGVQSSNREFSAIGEEAFVQPVDTKSLGVFWVGERDYGSFDLEAGLRFESVEHDPSEAGFGTLDFDTFSSSIGGVYHFSDAFRISGLIDYAGRAPSIEELYSNGPHLATQTFEVGDLTLSEEQSLGFTFTIDYAYSFFHLRSSVYLTEFDDFIYQTTTGGTVDGLPVFVYQQDNATFAGIDLEADITLAEIAGGKLLSTLFFDTVDAEIDGPRNQNLPRIPASRYGAGLEWASDNWVARLNYVIVSSQNDTAELELATDSYDDLSLYVARSLETAVGDVQLFLHGRNLSDDEQRRHESFVKDFAPAPGRRFEVGLRLRF